MLLVKVFEVGGFCENATAPNIRAARPRAKILSFQSSVIQLMRPFLVAVPDVLARLALAVGPAVEESKHSIGADQSSGHLHADAAPQAVGVEVARDLALLDHRDGTGLL